jgi:hypothetical protein
MHMDRQGAALVVVGVEQRELPMAVHGIGGVGGVPGAKPLSLLPSPD